MLKAFYTFPDFLFFAILFKYFWSGSYRCFSPYTLPTGGLCRPTMHLNDNILMTSQLACIVKHPGAWRLPSVFGSCSTNIYICLFLRLTRVHRTIAE